MSQRLASHNPITHHCRPGAAMGGQGEAYER